ncbi:HD domain-containing protein [Pseudogemmatithrix spongiicola]|uniref:HD domain-containing protein n=1 Tax=Pseudogemmatithrix spongiicola TaxID=3062599 RepID=A0AA49Q546_9BACT|nr:HD domain-containing protein [Gemmatimonadaceae bacterium 'strain 138']WKW15625.1 HD domain-containing protein [Gemmatimonadaceae bacterium 'strain 318']
MPTLRDPLWNNIRIEGPYLRLLDTPAFQRLRYVRQLGLAHLVYPGATHSRFEHALGAYHLAQETVRILRETSVEDGFRELDGRVVIAAALLHDIGHYPFSHALEELGVPHHETVAGPLIAEGAVAEILRSEFATDAPERILALVRGESQEPLQGLISGSIDLDKIDYLKRDAMNCGVSYGEVDVDRLRHALVLVTDPVTGRRAVGLKERGLSALESLLFAKYQMYRNVYWHHAVRSATAMYKRLVEDALQDGSLDPLRLAQFTDEGLLHDLERGDRPLVAAIRERRLFKRALEVPAFALADYDLEWLADDRARIRLAEDALAASMGLKAGELLLDFPRKERMLGLDLPLLAKDGSVHRLTDAGLAGTLNLPILGEQLYQSARWLRVFTSERRSVALAEVLAVLGR